MGQDQDDIIIVPISTYATACRAVSAGRLKRVRPSP